jgi:hypothetical protein
MLIFQGFNWKIGSNHRPIAHGIQQLQNERSQSHLLRWGDRYKTQHWTILVLHKVLNIWVDGAIVFVEMGYFLVNDR